MDWSSRREASASIEAYYEWRNWWSVTVSRGQFVWCLNFEGTTQDARLIQKTTLLRWSSDSHMTWCSKSLSLSLTLYEVRTTFQSKENKGSNTRKLVVLQDNGPRELFRTFPLFCTFNLLYKDILFTHNLSQTQHLAGESRHIQYFSQIVPARKNLHQRTEPLLPRLVSFEVKIYNKLMCKI